MLRTVEDFETFRNFV